MRNFNSIAIVLLTLISVTVCGCESKDYSLAPVSGTVTFEGKPVDKLRVSFSPQAIGEDYAVGPYSQGKTDSGGKFTLVTRYGDEGAVIGKHTLAFEYSDVSETTMSDLRADLLDAQEAGSKERFDEVKKRIADVKARLKGRPVLDASYSTSVIDVPSDGHTDLQIEISELGKNDKE